MLTIHIVVQDCRFPKRTQFSRSCERHCTAALPFSSHWECEW